MATAISQSCFSVMVHPPFILSGFFLVYTSAPLGLAGVELVVLALLRQQLLMVAALDDAPVLQHQNGLAVGRPFGRPGLF